MLLGTLYEIDRFVYRSTPVVRICYGLRDFDHLVLRGRISFEIAILAVMFVLDQTERAANMSQVGKPNQPGSGEIV
jgi:hypothetical protein